LMVAWMAVRTAARLAASTAASTAEKWAHLSAASWVASLAVWSGATKVAM
jgi:hypothetical protein